MKLSSRIFVAGSKTLAGAALIERLRAEGFHNLVGLPPAEPGPSDQLEVEEFFMRVRPEYVFCAVGPSGGIRLNQTQPAQLALHNLLGAAHIISQAYRYGCKRLIYLGSSCCYPKNAPQPMRVESLMTGELEPTSEGYASAKLAGLQLCKAYRRQYGVCFIGAFPGDTFGPHDSFDAEDSHVVPALIRKLHYAKECDIPSVTLWGSGTPRRQFLYAPDLADACVFLMREYDDAKPINIGGCTELSIAELAAQLADIVGYRGVVHFDATKPDGAPRKALDSEPLHALGWSAYTDFRTALIETYDWFLHHVATEEQRVPATV